MTENDASAPEDATAARAAEQARIRKERREAKIRAGGSARLNKITGLGGGIQRDPPTTPSSQPDTTSEKAGADTGADTTQHGDPDEVDISQHYYAPRTTARSPATAATPPLDESNISEAQMREMMLGFDRPGGNPFLNPPVPGAGAGGEDDPMMKLLSQMMSGAGGPGGPGGPFGGGNPFAQAGGPFGAPPGQPAVPATPDRYASIWRLVHFVVAFGLGLYIALFTTFSGTKIERERAAVESTTAKLHEDEDNVRRYFFWAFATAETVLLTSRFFLDRGRAPPSGMLWTIVGFLPEPFKGYLGVGLRYGQIFSTVRSDMLVCVFVLGVCHLLRAA